MIALNQNFEGLTITLDGGTFRGCTFTRCRLQFSGIMPVGLGGNRFDQCEWDFIGPAATTLAFMQTLYHDQGGVELIEKLFGVVRERTPITAIAAR